MDTLNSSTVKCYLSEIDDNFDPKKDIILGPWCLTSISQSLKISCVEPYGNSEKRSLFKKLFDLSFYLMNRDLQNIADEKKQKELYICNQAQYLYFVFYAFSRYRYVKNTLKNRSVSNDILFEDVEIDEKKILEKFDPQIYKDPRVTGWLSLKIIEFLFPDCKIRKFKRIKNTDVSSLKELDVRVFSEKKYSKIRKFFNHLNYFSDIKGISTINGIILSFIYFLIGSNKKTFINIYSPCPIFDKELLEFVEVYNGIHELFINKVKMFSDKPDEKTKKRYKKLYISTPSFMYVDEKIREYAKAIVYHGSRGIICQHGSYYGSVENHFFKEIESGIAEFFSWGKEFYSIKGQCRILDTLPFPYLSSIYNKYEVKNQTDILWITGSHYKTGDGLQHYTGNQVIEYVIKKRQLFERMSEKVKSKILYKELYHLKEMFPDEFSLFCNRKVCDFQILDHMHASRLIVLDYYGTPLYEALALNVPIVLVMLEAKPFFTLEAEMLFKKLQKARIVFYDIQKAADFLNSLSEEDIAIWWNSLDVQSLRSEFLEKYANSKPYFWAWAKDIFLKKF